MYVFESKIIHIPSSFNRVGIDPLPRYFVRPTKLKEILNYSHNPSSVGRGYKKDKKSGLYLKNINEISKVDVQAQFDLISITPPFWFMSEDSYTTFIHQTMNSTYSEQIQLRFSTRAKKYYVDQDVDDEITAPHFYAKDEDYITQSFFNNIWKIIPKFKNVSTYDKATAIAGQIVT